ncbi:pentapeptide repeat-containing protein [Nocardiopsis flavescens]|uniref:pentapeptide repeat-containing protein n=1 Tax=Nocardiopsis flavescens TaxID=758803 RepID=UPI0036580CB7
MRSPTPRQWTGIALAAVALPALTTTAWPLLTFLWDLTPPGLPTARILLGTALVLVLVIAAVLIRAQSQTQVRLWWLIVAAWAVAVGAVAGMVVLIWLILGTPGLQLPTDLPPRALDAIATRAFAVVAGLGGVALLVINYRRQRTTEADSQRAEKAAHREVTKLFNERFTVAYTELGSDHAAVRLGAVHALAHLADDAPTEQETQMVIDVLCAYLRMPYAPAPEALAKNASKVKREEHRQRKLEFASFREVRHTIIRIIGNRLRSPTRWQGKDYDFTGVVFDGGNLAQAKFTGGKVLFSWAEFAEGIVDFSRAEFTGGEVDFIWAKFTGGRVDFSWAKFTVEKMDFRGANFTGGTVDFSRAEFTGGEVDFSWTEFTGGLVAFTKADFSGGSVVFDSARFTDGMLLFSGAKFSGGKVLFSGVEFSGGKVLFSGAEFSGGKVLFSWAEFSGGSVDFTSGKFTGGKVVFRGAEFTAGEILFTLVKLVGGTVDFTRAEFIGGEVVFHDVELTGGAVDFGWGGFVGDLDDFERARGTCPTGLREARALTAPGILLYPEAWSHRSEEGTSEALKPTPLNEAAP